MESHLMNGYKHIEFLGTPGSGKTTLLPVLSSYLYAHNWRPYTVVEAARPFTRRSKTGKLVSRLVPGSLKNKILWQVFYLSSLASRRKFYTKNRELIQQVMDFQRSRPAAAGVTERGVIHWFERLAGSFEFLVSYAQPGEILLFDDGFVHRTIHLFASDVEEPDPLRIRQYLDLIPKPDLVIIPHAPLDTCLERVVQRGVWKHASHKTPQEIRQYLTNAEMVVNTVSAYLQEKNWPLLTLDNSAEGARSSQTEMIRKLDTEPLFSGLQEGTKIDNTLPIAVTPYPTAARVPGFPRPSRLSGSIRSRMRPLDIDLATIEHILREFGFSMTSPAQNLPLSRRTHNVLVFTKDGKHVVKQYRKKLPVSTIEYINSILLRLEELNFPSLRLALTQNGETFVTHAEYNYSVTSFVEGRSYSQSLLQRDHRLSLLASAGETMARLHQALSDFSPSGSHHLGFSSTTGKWMQDYAWHEQKARELHNMSLKHDHQSDQVHLDWLVENYQSILDELKVMDGQLDQAGLKRLIVHGDYGLHNLVYPQDAPITVLDFETARLEWRLSDLVSALSRLRFKSGAYDFAAMAAFLRGYTSYFPIPKDEWEWLPSVWRFYKLRSAIIYWNSYFETGGPVRKLISARDAVSQADWVIQHPQSITQLIDPKWTA